MATQKEVVTELKRLLRVGGGVLQPESVVEAARPADSPLHSRFEWNNSKAAQEYRIWQARMLIRVTVQVLDAKSGKTDRVFVSLKSDRYEERGGYRALVSVLSDEDLRRQLLLEALEEFSFFREKYGRLKELAAVFEAMKKVKAA